MKSILLLIFIFNVNVYSQGLGLTKKQVQEQRYKDKYIEGITEAGYKYIKYNCNKEYACLTTTYVFNKIKEVILVMEIFDLEYLPITLEYLNKTNLKHSDFVWTNKKDFHLIELKINSKYNQFILIYINL